MEKKANKSQYFDFSKINGTDMRLFDVFATQSVSQSQIRDYSRPLFEFVPSPYRTFQELHRVTSHTRDHISKGTATVKPQASFPVAADYMQALNDVRIYLIR